MKFNPTHNQIALIIVLLGAVVLAHAYVPSSAAAVLSMVGVIVGWLTPSFAPKEDEKKGGGQ